MKTIQEEVNNILKSTRNQEVKGALRIVKAEFQREKTKEISDERALKVIRGLIKHEKERISHIDVFMKGGSDSKEDGLRYIHILTCMIPLMVGEGEIKDWIVDNIDFSNFKNPLQAIKVVMAHFGTSADSTTVREVIESMSK